MRSPCPGDGGENPAAAKAPLPTLPSEPGPNHPFAVTDKRITANRRNALKSTGPRTKTGKAAVAKNSIGHGIFSIALVIEPIESRREWNQYWKGMLASLAPCGMLEMTFAERVISTAWRLRRVMRYETEQVQSTQEGAEEVIANQFRDRAASRGNDAVRNAEYLLSDIVARSEGGDYGDDEYVRDDTELNEEDAQELLSRAYDDLGWADKFDDYWRTLPKPESLTAGLVRQLVSRLADRHYEFSAKLMAVKLKPSLENYRREHLVPGQETLQKVMRYEAYLSRQFYRDLHELQRLQAMRQGQRVAAPIAIDVDVASGHTTGSDSGS